MAVGWFDTVAEAEAYFDEERLETTAWDALTEASGNLQRTKALKMAYNRLYYSGIKSLPTQANATAAQLVPLKKAQAEMAYYLAQHLADEDRRKGLHAQGVIVANVVKEMSAGAELAKLPIPPFVLALLSDFDDITDTPLYVVDIDRDEDYTSAEDLTGDLE